MVLAALANDDQALKASQYRVLDLWQSTYDGALRSCSRTFEQLNLEERADWTADWTGSDDSKNPYVAATNTSNG